MSVLKDSSESKPRSLAGGMPCARCVIDDSIVVCGCTWNPMGG